MDKRKLNVLVRLIPYTNPIEAFPKKPSFSILFLSPLSSRYVLMHFGRVPKEKRRLCR